VIASEVLEPQPGRILHLVGTSVPHTLAGYTVRTQHSVRAQIAAGLDAIVATRAGYPWDIDAIPTDRTEVVGGVPYVRSEGTPKSERLDQHLAATASAMASLVEELRPAVIHAHSDFLNGLVASVLGDAFDIPIVYEARGFWEETWLSARPNKRTPDDPVYKWRRAREIQVMRRADHVVTLAETMVDRIAGDGIDRAHISIVPNAVDPGAFPLLDRSDRSIRQALGIPDRARTIGYISSLSRYEGVETLIRGTRVLRDGDVDVHCLIVGDGREMDRLMRIAAKEGVEEVVHFTGRVPHEDVLDYYAALDVFVVPRRDTRVTRLVQPLKPYEALSTGLPLVVSDVPALSLIVDASGAGDTFTPQDPTDLARAVLPILENPSLAGELGERGAAFVRRHHTWDQNAARYRQIYDRLGVL
jgi:glycosyltransferase involved in cell wall biosynthesis